MRKSDSFGSNSISRAPFVSLASTLLLAAPAIAHPGEAQGWNFSEGRGNQNKGNRAELRQMARDHFSNAPLQIQPVSEDRVRRHIDVPPVVQTQNIIVDRQIRQAVAQVQNNSTFINANGRERNLPRGLELDLSSDNRGIILGDNMFSSSSSYTIKVGDQEKVLTSGQRVSAAEFVALQQIIGGESQSLVVDNSGRGVDGQFNLSNISDAGRNIRTSSLVIPTSVDATGNFAKNGDIRLTGNLVNNGTIYATSDKAGVTAKIGARNITNSADALISSVVPSGGDSQSPLDLNLSAVRDFNNSGSITSSGSLTITAGNSINNNGSAAVLSAANDVNLVSGQVANSGSISAISGNVNFNTVEPASINIDSTGGTISALNGAINIREKAFTPKVDTTLTGGDWLSKELNLNAGDGRLVVRAGEVTGAVTAHGGFIDIAADTEDLNLNGIVATGDPLIQNSGNVIIAADVITASENISIIAGQNISFNSGIKISTTSTSAGDILMVAGANFTLTSDLKITGGTGTGGNILFTGTAPVITANSTAGDGGNVTLVAFSDAGFTTGNISLAGSTIETKGSAG